MTELTYPLHGVILQDLIDIGETLDMQEFESLIFDYEIENLTNEEL